MRNKFPGVCYRCGKPVEKGEGHFEKIRNSWPVKWRTQHATCAIEFREKRKKEQMEAQNGSN